jgi:hypothetical protein
MLPNSGEFRNMKDREIQKHEINKITALCPKREKAFFTIMRQSGLAPHIIKQLKIKNLEKILDSNTPIPCKIKTKFRSHPDFIGQEAIKYLKQYLDTRKNKNLTLESLLFTIRNNPNKENNTKDVSRAFRANAQKLARTKKITYNIKKGEPNELRLYSLIKFYRKNAKDYLSKLNNNHTLKNDEFYRKLYEEKAMPYLEIEPPTPIEIYQLKKQLTKIEDKLFPKETLEERKEMEELIKEHDEYEQWLQEHPEEVEKWERERQEDEKRHKGWRKEHPKGAKREDEQMKKEYEQMDEDYKNYMEYRIKELENQIDELRQIMKKPKGNRTKEYS